jgi:hypothetical protein
MTDLYTKIEGDPGFVNNVIEVNTDLDFLLTQIEVILFTEKTEVMGSNLLGANLSTMIFQTNVSASMIEEIVNEQIRSYCPLSNTYNVKTQCQFFKGIERDIALLDIIINDSVSVGVTFA